MKIKVKFSPKKAIKKIAKVLFTLTLIPYGIATFKELKTVDWMTYWTTVKVTFFVLLFSAITATFVFGADQVISKVLDLVIKKV